MTINEDEIPAFLKDGKEPDLLEEMEDEDDDSVFDFPSEDEGEAVASPPAETETLLPSVEGRPASNFGAEKLRSYIERLEKLKEQKDEISADMREVLAEAKGTGFNPKNINAVLKLRRQDPEKRKLEREELDLYLWSLGMADE